jgi:hypothetical protein
MMLFARLMADGTAASLDETSPAVSKVAKSQAVLGYKILTAVTRKF